MSTTKHLITAKEYAESQDYQLDIQQSRRLGQVAQQLYKAANNTLPPRITRRGNKARGYDLLTDANLLDQAIADTMSYFESLNKLQSSL